MIVPSCKVPKKYQKNKPFIYKSTIVLNSNLKSGRKQVLHESLANQIDDSLKVRTVIAVRFIPPFFYNRLSKPPVFDTAYIGRSRIFMNSLLNSQGYFSPLIRDTFSIDTVRDQQRVSVKFFVTPGMALKLDSIAYQLLTPELQALALSTRESALAKKNDPYSVQAITSELDRLLTTFRDHGYYKISKEDLYAEQDTVVAALIDPSLDPFEQLALLDSLQKRKKQPTINVIFKQRPPKDSTHIEKYAWGNINVFPDRSFVQESASDTNLVRKVGPYTFYHNSDKFKLPFIARNIPIKPGALYKQSDYFKTVNTFTNLGAWQQVDVDLRERFDSLHLLDADILLFPAKRQSLNIDVESSRNTSDVFTTGSLFGLGINLGVKNRNSFHESITSTTNLRFGVELGPNIIQTFQASFSHNIYVPRFIVPFGIKVGRNVTAPRTIFNFNTAYTRHKSFYDLRSFNTSFGYDWSKKNHSWAYIPINLEYTKVFKEDSLNKLIDSLPAVGLAFNDGLIIGQVLSYTTGSSKGKTVNFFRARLEESGAITGLIHSLDTGELRRFIKLDLEYKYFINNAKSTWAFRVFGGYGLAYGKIRGDTAENNLPFFKAYFAGGPYSMRAWPIRGLGLGSSNFLDTIPLKIQPPRFGDMKLEVNVEYRFNLATVFGIKIKSALFADMGNIWGKSFDKNYKKIDSAQFKLSRIYTDLAIGAGTSLRFDFDFFLIRLDWAYQVKNPVFATASEGWFHKLQIKSGQFQLGIGYPF
ncbi:MAG: BamA/TamA family outer membrane protein [Flavitalea sp.]